MERLVVAAGSERKINADNRDLLNTGKEARFSGTAPADRNGLSVEQVFRLILYWRSVDLLESRVQMRVGIGQERGRPMHVCEAEPRIGGAVGNGLLPPHFGVGCLLQAFFAKHPDRSFMQDVEPEDLGALP